MGQSILKVKINLHIYDTLFQSTQNKKGRRKKRQKNKSRGEISATELISAVESLAATFYFYYICDLEGDSQISRDWGRRRERNEFKVSLPFCLALWFTFALGQKQISCPTIIMQVPGRDEPLPDGLIYGRPKQILYLFLFLMFFISQLPIIKYHFKWSPPLPGANSLEFCLSHFVFCISRINYLVINCFRTAIINDAATFSDRIPQTYRDLSFYPTDWPNSFIFFHIFFFFWSRGDG